MSPRACKHPDIRKFDGIRSCLACGEAVFERRDEQNPARSFGQDLSQPYQYSDLNYKLGQEIRLCILRPGEPTDDLHCELIHVNLEDDPIFDAVSYTWATEAGDTEFSSSIYCPGRGRILITANCCAVLRQLRRRGNEKRLWIDAICINQKDVTERGHQVNIMDRIYSTAQSVRVCISDVPETQWRLQSSYCALLGRLQTSGDWRLSEEELGSLVHLLSMKYFKRVWVIQEVVLARAAYLHLNEHELLLTTQVLKRLRTLCKTYCDKIPAVIKWNPGEQHTQSNVIACLNAGFESQSSDPRDLVYAVLSLMDTQSRELIPVDYKLHSTAIYANALVAMINNHRNLDILKKATSHRPHFHDQLHWLHTPSLSISQLRDYVQIQERRANADLAGDATYTSVEHCPQSRLKDTNNIWRCQIEFEHADSMRDIPVLRDPDNLISRALYQPRPDATNTNILPRVQVRAHLIDRIRIPNIDTSKLTDRSPSWLRNSIFSWILLRFRRDPSMTGSTKHYTIGGKVVSQIQHQDVKLSDLEKFWNSYTSFSSGMMFSSYHSIGKSDNRLIPYDQVWVVDSVDQPLILRPIAFDALTYRVVGPCYIWAALELDYWNPGTKKGVWREDSIKPPREEQTKIIEIY